jgi:cytochrome c oxidase cbb3-type subunit 2
MAFKHDVIERNSLLLLIGIILVVSVGGLVEIAPLFWIDSTIEKTNGKVVKGVRPYSPLELAGRNIYRREGCYLCHSQQIRSLKDEITRYGHFSLAAESMYDYPFQWGSKRTGPDLARVGGKFSDKWHVEHLIAPRSVVEKSVMPGYPFLAKAKLDYGNIADHMKTLKLLDDAKGYKGYTKEQIDNATADLEAQVKPDTDEAKALLKRYPKAVVSEFDGDPSRITEMDALVAYLQVLGTMVDFNTYKDEGDNLR